MLSKNKNLYLTAVILFIAFLIEGPLYAQIIVLFSSIPELGYLITGVIGYIAMLVCILLVTKRYFNRYNFIKALGSVLAVAFIHRIALTIFNTAIVALIYQILRPAIQIAFIWFTVKSISECEPKKDNKLLVASVIVFAINVVISVYQYIILITTSQSMGNNFFLYLSILSGAPFFYDSTNMSLCRYVLIFITFIFSQKCITYKDGDI